MNVVQSMSVHEKEKVLETKVIYQGGKSSGQLVPVIVIKELVDVSDAMADRDIRPDCVVCAEKQFLFPSTGKTWTCSKLPLY